MQSKIEIRNQDLVKELRMPLGTIQLAFYDNFWNRVFLVYDFFVVWP